MTCIIFDGIELAADCMSSYIDPHAPADGKCEHCGVIGPNLITKATKIVFGVKGAMFNNEQIIAMAGSGRADYCHGLMTTLNRNGKLGEFYRTAVDIGMAGGFPDIELLVITENAPYLINFNGKQYRAHTPELPVIIGSASVADFCMKSYRIPARVGVALSATWTRGVGNGVQYLNVAAPERTLNDYPAFERKGKSLNEVRQFILNSISLRNPNGKWKAHASVPSVLEAFLKSV